MKCRIVVADEFYANPDRMRELALDMEYGDNGISEPKFTPGVRKRIEKVLEKPIREWDSDGDSHGTFHLKKPSNVGDAGHCIHYDTPEGREDFVGA